MAVSSAGANPKVRNFYLRTKGEVEEKLAGIGFGGICSDRHYCWASGPSGGLESGWHRFS